MAFTVNCSVLVPVSWPFIQRAGGANGRVERGCSAFLLDAFKTHGSCVITMLPKSIVFGVSSGVLSMLLS